VRVCDNLIFNIILIEEISSGGKKINGDIPWKMWGGVGKCHRRQL